MTPRHLQARRAVVGTTELLKPSVSEPNWQQYILGYVAGNQIACHLGICVVMIVYHCLVFAAGGSDAQQPLPSPAGAEAHDAQQQQQQQQQTSAPEGAAVGADEPAAALGTAPAAAPHINGSRRPQRAATAGVAAATFAAAAADEDFDDVSPCMPPREPLRKRPAAATGRDADMPEAASEMQKLIVEAARTKPKRAKKVNIVCTSNGLCPLREPLACFLCKHFQVQRYAFDGVKQVYCMLSLLYEVVLIVLCCLLLVACCLALCGLAG
jgi:hypothetical protein